MKKSARKTFTFGLLLAAVLLFMLAASLSLMAVISSWFTRRSVEDLSERIVQQTLARVELRIDALLAQAVNHNSQMLRLLDGRQIDSENFVQLGGYLAHSLEVFEELTYLGYGRETNGDYIFAERVPHGPVRVREYVADESGQRVIRDSRWQGARREIIQTLPWDGYDPRKRPFYQLAVQSRTNVWTETYQFWQSNERGAVPGVTYATPRFDADGRLLGVLNADFDLAALAHFLAEVKAEIPGYAFVVERRTDGARRLIAHPDPALLPQSATETNALAFARDPVAAAFVEQVMMSEARLQGVLGGKILSFDAQDQGYFGSVRRFEHAGDPPWAIGLIIPRDDVMATVHMNDRRAFWIGLGCLTLTALVAVRVARRIAEPLRQLSREARAIGRLELQHTPDGGSRVEEVAHLTSSFAEMKMNLRSFQKFVPADVVRELVTTAQEAKLDGRHATLTMFFSDVAGFTSIAEQMKAESLVKHVGEYLGAMSDVILAEKGTVDKFIGDGIMAFWGAPRANPIHALDACRAALECQRILGHLRERWRMDGKPVLHTRIGLHTGEVIVGNIGSERRLNYTVIGDSVNLTSRIEGLSKFYGTEILLSAACVEAAGDALLTRPVDMVSVKGRSNGIVVHELLGVADDPPPHVAERISLTEAAFRLYLASDFAAARERYLKLLQIFPADPVATLMCRRCAEFMAGPPPTEWDTTFRMREK